MPLLRPPVRGVQSWAASRSRSRWVAVPRWARRAALMSGASVKSPTDTGRAAPIAYLSQPLVSVRRDKAVVVELWIGRIDSVDLFGLSR
jgi:hypothetical protein